MLTGRIITDKPSREKLLTALLMLLSLKVTAIAIILGFFFIVVLTIFVIVLDALVELSAHIAQVWSASSSIERLLIFVLAWVLIAKVSPIIVKVCKLGKGF